MVLRSIWFPVRSSGRPGRDVVFLSAASYRTYNLSKVFRLSRETLRKDADDTDTNYQVEATIVRTATLRLNRFQIISLRWWMLISGPFPDLRRKVGTPLKRRSPLPPEKFRRSAETATVYWTINW